MQGEGSRHLAGGCPRARAAGASVAHSCAFNGPCGAARGCRKCGWTPAAPSAAPNPTAPSATARRLRPPRPQAIIMSLVHHSASAPLLALLLLALLAPGGCAAWMVLVGQTASCLASLLAQPSLVLVGLCRARLTRAPCCLELLHPPLLVWFLAAAHAGPIAYGICQTGCNVAWASCYAATGHVIGTGTCGKEACLQRGVWQGSFEASFRVCPSHQLTLSWCPPMSSDGWRRRARCGARLQRRPGHLHGRLCGPGPGAHSLSWLPELAAGPCPQRRTPPVMRLESANIAQASAMSQAPLPASATRRAVGTARRRKRVRTGVHCGHQRSLQMAVVLFTGLDLSPALRCK